MRARPLQLTAVPILALFAAHPWLPLYAAGALLVLAGQAVRLWAAGHIHKQERLATTGPYALVRNPLYAGSLLITLGWAAMSGMAVVGALVLLAYAATHWPTILSEERFLRDRFGAEYDDYCRQVPRLFPRVMRSAGDAETRRRGDAESGRPAGQSTIRNPQSAIPHGNFSWRQALYTNREGKSAVGVLLLAAAYGTRLWW